MIILPSYHSRKQKSAALAAEKRRVQSDQDPRTDSLETPHHRTQEVRELVEIKRLQLDTFEQQLPHVTFANGQPLGTGATANPSTEDRTLDPSIFKKSATNAPTAAGIPNDFDEYGQELGPEARVWKAYVKEADRVDAEKVDEWNKSLDVIQIFAALFSAISTAFVMESTKQLKADPAEISAKTLETISQTLLTIADRGQPLAATATTPSLDAPFSPGWSTICVNILWFLSLSLSVAVSLIAMLAKEWCHSFISGRTGLPGIQARRRQQRWEALEAWWMPEVLMFLPSLIHIALLLFAIGLCIYLWDIHAGVAVPVALVTLGACGIYVASTLLPLVYQFCPYSTTASKFINSFRKTVKEITTNTDTNVLDQDVTTSRALRWLIEKCEDPRSVDMALQAIAGADELPLEPLRECDAEKKVSRRLTSGSSYGGYGENYEVVFKLYARAFAVLHLPIKDQLGKIGADTNIGQLKKKIRDLQATTESTVASLLVTKDFHPTGPNVQALHIGSTAAPYCLQSLSYEPQRKALQSLDSALGLLVEYSNNRDLLHPAALQSLVMGTAILLSFSSLHSPTDVRYAARLLRVDVGEGFRGILLAALALSRRDHAPSGWTRPPPFPPTARAERSLDMIAHYARRLGRLNLITGSTLHNFGLLEILSNPEDYNLGDSDFEAIYITFAEISDNDPHIPRTFPQGFDLRRYVIEVITKRLSVSNEHDGVLANRASTEAFLKVLRHTYHQAIGPLTPQVYVFLVEAICQDTPRVMRFVGEKLIEGLFPNELADDLVGLISTRNTISLLVKALDSDNGSTKIFAMGQLCLLITLVLRSPYDHGRLAELIARLSKHEKTGNPLERLRSVREGLAIKITRSWDQPDHYFSLHYYTKHYLYHVVEFMASARTEITCRSVVD